MAQATSFLAKSSKKSDRGVHPVRSDQSGSVTVKGGSNRHSHTKTAAKVAVTNQVAKVRQTLGITQEELGRITGYATRSIAGWEQGKALSTSARHKMVEVDRLAAALAEIIEAEHLGDWLRTSNPAFEGQTPMQVLERGETDRLWRMIYQLQSGVAS